MARFSSTALPVAYVLLRILIVLNILSGVAILALLVAMPNAQWIIQSFDLAPGAEADRMIFALRVAAGLGLAAVPVNHAILKRLVAMVETVRAGDPFIAANAARLQAIAWGLLALQLIGAAIGMIGDWLSTPSRPIDLDAGASIGGWLAVLLIFVLARVFAEGTLMREDLEGTV